MYPPTDPLIRFWKFVQKSPDGCWLWTGCINKRHGYGSFSRSRCDPVRAHKWLWEQFNGPVPSGLHLHHTCGVKHCVNPSHLEVVSPRDHMIRHPDHIIAKQIAQTTCKNGHPFDRMEGTKRRCRICATNNRRELRQNDGGKWNAYQREYARSRKKVKPT